MCGAAVEIPHRKNPQKKNPKTHPRTKKRLNTSSIMLESSCAARHRRTQTSRKVKCPRPRQHRLQEKARPRWRGAAK